MDLSAIDQAILEVWRLPSPSTNRVGVVDSGQTRSRFDFGTCCRPRNPHGPLLHVADTLSQPSFGLLAALVREAAQLVDVAALRGQLSQPKRSFITPSIHQPTQFREIPTLRGSGSR